jgi:hypothetical protein
MPVSCVSRCCPRPPRLTLQVLFRSYEVALLEMLHDNESPAEDLTELAIFDIDGPVTDPVKRRIEQLEILDLSLDFIMERGYIAYNTGRASSIAQQRVVSLLLARARARGISQQTASRRISIFAEKGAVTSSWDDNRGNWSHHVDPAAVVADGLRRAVRDLLRSDPEFQKYIFLDADKETMVSVEMRHESCEPKPAPTAVNVFKPVAERFAAEIRKVASDRGYDDLEIDCTTIAVDIQRRGVGKDLGTRLAFGWLDRLGKQVKRVHCFGDSRSDVAMAVEAYSLMRPRYADAAERVIYVNVGEDFDIDGEFEVRKFPGRYGHGTIAYLQALL